MRKLCLHVVVACETVVYIYQELSVQKIIYLGNSNAVTEVALKLKSLCIKNARMAVGWQICQKWKTNWSCLVGLLISNAMAVTSVK